MNPYETKEYQAFVDEMVKHCWCDGDRPCDGVLAGGLCDGIDEEEETGHDDHDEQEEE